MTSTQLPLVQHPATWRLTGEPGGQRTNPFGDRSVYVVDVPSYDLYRSLLYALGARSVSNKMMAHVDTIVHGAQPPAKARSKYPNGKFIPAREVLPLFHQEVDSFEAYVKALQRHGFTVRNPSDEGDPDFEFFTLPVTDGSLHATLLHWLATSDFIAGFVDKQSFPIDTREPSYVDFPVPKSKGVTWYYAWQTHGWARVSAQRGEGDYPLEIKGVDLLAVLPVLYTESTGMFFFEYPNIDSVSGLFIQAGIDARTGQVHGAAISRVWT